MSPISAINSSNVSFTGKKHKKAADQAEKPKYGGNKTMEEKYGKMNLTTETAPIVVDYVKDKAAEALVTAGAFLLALKKGQKATNGLSQAIAETFAKKASTVGAEVVDIGTIKKLQTAVTDALKKVNNNNIDSKNIQKEIAASGGIKGLIKGILPPPKAYVAADNDVAKAAKKLGLDEGKADKIGRFFAEKLGIAKAPDVIDTAASVGAAGVIANVANDGADIVTDLDDEEVAAKARKRATAKETLGKAEKLMETGGKLLNLFAGDVA